MGMMLGGEDRMQGRNADVDSRMVVFRMAAVLILSETDRSGLSNSGLRWFGEITVRGRLDGECQ
jgi:hypothetical protein